MVNSGLIIVSCLTVNTIVNLFHPLIYYVNKLRHWYKRILKYSFLISRNDNGILFKNISWEISKRISHRAKKNILTLLEQQEEKKGQIVLTVLPPNESILFEIGSLTVIEIIVLGEGQTITGYEILFAQGMSDIVRSFLIERTDPNFLCKLI